MIGRLRIASWVALAVAGVVVAGVAIAEGTGWPFLRGPLQHAMVRAAGVPVQVAGRFHARLLWRPRLEIERLTVGAAGGVTAPHLLDGHNVALEWRWRDLWHWQRGGVLRLRALQAGMLDVQLVRAGDGRASWHLGRPLQPPQQPEAMPPGGAQALPRIGSMMVSDGRIVVDDQVLDTQLQIALQGRESTAANAQAGSGFRASITGRYRTLPLDLRLQSGSVLPLLQDDDDDNDNTSPASPLLVKGTLGEARVGFDGKAASLLSARELEGSVQFSGPSLAPVGAPFGVTLPQTPAFQLQGRLAHRGGIWSLLSDRATIGQSQLAGDFRYDTRSKPSRLSGRLNGSRLLLADLGPSVGAETGGSAAQPRQQTSQPAPGRVLPQRKFDVPSMRAMDADVQVAIDELVFSTDAMAPMRGLRTHVRLNAGVLDLEALKANVAGGQVAGSTRLDTNVEPAKWGAQLHFGNVDIAGWLRGVRTPQGKRSPPPASNARALKREREATLQATDQPPPSYVTGRLDAEFNVTGKGHSTAEILGSLDGRSHVTLHDATLSHLVTEAIGLDLAQALGVLIRGDRPLPLRCARFDFLLDNGVMKTQRGVVDNSDSTIRVAGTIDLRNETLGLVARVRPKDVSPLSLRTPVTVTGPIGAPVIGIQGRQLSGRVLGALALAAVTPLAALLPLIDPGERDQRDPCAEPPASAPAASAASRGEPAVR